MSINIHKMPLVSITNVFLDFLQSRFSNPEKTPPEFRWNRDENKSIMYITGPYTVTRDKIGTKPSITVQRSGFTFRNMTIDNMEGADAVTFTNKKHRDLLDGTINVICEAGTDIETTGLANFVSLLIESDRHLISGAVDFIHEFKWAGISDARPVKEEAEIVRWECVVSFRVTMQFGWISESIGLDEFNQVNIFAFDQTLPGWESSNGNITQGSASIVDIGANFGLLNTSKPQLLEAEYNKRWYFIIFDVKKYIVEEIIDEHTLRLSDTDKDGNTIPYNPSETEIRNYKLVWDSVHINVELKKGE